MGRIDLNLSTRPFKPYRVVNLVLFVILLGLAAVSVRQFYSYREYSKLAAAIRDEEREARALADAKAKQRAALASTMSGGGAAAKLSEVEFLNSLILKKSFSWTQVFATLEDRMPDDVYLLGLQPFTDDQGKIGLNMKIRGRSLASAADFVSILESSGVFGDVTVAVEEKMDAVAAGEVEVTLGAYYFPDRSAQ